MEVGETFSQSHLGLQNYAVLILLISRSFGTLAVPLFMNKTFTVYTDVLKQDDLGVRCIRIQSHVYVILLDPLQFSIRQLLHLHAQCLLQLIQGSPHGPYV
ncbi:unnamed protein product [Boreogadus saida]